MRNLKKVLSLALALVMLLGMMVIGASAADFKDASSIKNEEAVDVVSGIEVLKGDEKGNFNPTGTLTRAEAAVVIAKLDLGEAFGNLATTNASTFTDVAANHWAKAYIDYCAARGLIVGSAGKFMPNDKVSGVQFALMVCRVLGYEDKAEQVGGADWEVKAAALARKAGLTKDVTIGSQAMTRDEMAQVAFNALKADMVFYSQPGTEINTGNGSIIIGGTPATKTDELLMEQKFPKLDVATGSDSFGRPSNKWTYGIKTIANAAHTATYTLKDGFKGKDVYGKVGSIAAGAGFTWTVTVDGEAGADSYLASTFKGNVTATNTTDYAGNGAVTEIYVDTDPTVKTVKVCVINTYLAQVAGYDADDEELTLDEKSAGLTLSGGNDVLSADDFANLAGFEEGDYVLITVADGVVKSIVKAETVTAPVTGYTTGKTVTFNDEKHKYSDKRVSGIENWSYAVGEDCVFILDGAGYVIGLDEVAGSSDYVYVDEFDKNGNFSSAQVIGDAFFPDGTHKTINVKKVFQSDGSTAISYTQGHANGGWYTYTEKDEAYTLTQVGTSGAGVGTVARTELSGTASNANAAATVVTTNGAVTVKTGAATSVRANNKTVFVLLDGNGVTTYEGIKNVPSVSIKSTGEATALKVVVAASVKNGYANYVFIDASAAGAANIEGATSDTSDQIYILDATADTGKDSDGNSIWSYKAILNGKSETVTANASGIFSDVGLYRAVKYDSDGYVDAATRVADESNNTYKAYDFTAAAYNSVKYGGNVLTVGHSSTPVDFILAEEHSILTVNGTTVKAVAAEKLAKDYASGFNTANVRGDIWVVLNSKGEVTNMYVDIKGTVAGVAAIYKVTAPTSAIAAANASSKVSVTIGGKAYEVAKTENTVKKQADAWCTAYNADTTTNGSGNWSATADTNGKVTVTYKDDTALSGADDAAKNTSGITGAFTNGDGSGTAAKVEVAAAAQPSTTAGTNDLFSMTIGGKAYTMATTVTDLADQIAAWKDAYNADTGTNTDYTAAVGTGDDAGKIVLTAKVPGEKADNGASTNLTGGTFTNGVTAVD